MHTQSERKQNIRTLERVYFRIKDYCSIMQGFRRYAGILCSAFIVVMAIVHFGVSGGIIGRFREYSDVFRPEIGLSAFNIVIGFFALLIGSFGLFSALTHRGNLGMYNFYFSINKLVEKGKKNFYF